MKLNKKTWFWPKYSVFILTSGDVITPPSPCEGSGNTLGVAASVRGTIQHDVFSDKLPPMRGNWGAVWGSHTHKLTLSPRLRRAWSSHRSILGCFLIGPFGSREQIDDVSYANECRDPLKQYPYCLSRALIGYSPRRPYILLICFLSTLLSMVEWSHSCCDVGNCQY